MPELSDIRETFEIHTCFSPVTCPVCGEKIRGRDEQIDGAINHVLAHGWRLQRWTLSFRQLSGQIKVKSGVIGQAASGCDGAG